MSYLKVTLIDVGWGDSILIEASDSTPGATRPQFALIDSNDNAQDEYWPTLIFLKKHFGLRNDEFDVVKPFFNFIMLTHDHSDHGTGLKRIVQKFGTDKFWYPKVIENESVVVTSLHDFLNRSSSCNFHMAVDSNYIPGSIGDAAMDFLWPPPERIAPEPNNNSIVLSLTLHNKTVLLTGDAEGKVWKEIAGQIPADTCVFKVPHHGSKNGTFYDNKFPWLDQLDQFPSATHLAISCHPTFPGHYDFPDPDIINKFKQRPYPIYETDQNYHITFTIDDNGLRVKYSH